MACITFVNLKINSQTTNIICFFLILSIGVSHGSLDHFKGYKILRFYKIKYKIIFYLSYTFISLFVIVSWVLLPALTLIIFLLIASYHFGKEDSEFGKISKTKFINFYLFLKGSIIILAPLWFSPSETIGIFEILNVKLNTFDGDIVLVLIILSLASNCFISKNILIGMIDSFSVIILNFTFNPLVAFTIYFCFLHSVRHSISLIKKLNSKNLYQGLRDFIKKALPLTLITAILFLINLYFLSNNFILSEAILKIIFIGLASLTFPHILLEYLIEKNEK